MTDLSGQYLGRYYLTERLGEGGMATVYKGYDTRLERDVAVKIIRSAAFPEEEIGAVLKRFEREAKSLAKLSHPNIVKVYDYGDHDGSPYLVMEYLPGGTLKKFIGKPMPWQDAVKLLLPIARGVAYAHQRGILHRDIKPANILITDGGEPMLSDFGIAKLFEGEQSTALTGSGMAIGTPEYMAPEQWTGITSQQSDLYSLGIVLYEMVAGRKPYVGDTPAAILIKQATEPLPSPRKFAVDLPESLEHVLIKALAKEPADRYQNISSFIEALENLNREVPAAEVPESKPVVETFKIPLPKPSVSIPRELSHHDDNAVESQHAKEVSSPVAQGSHPIEGRTLQAFDATESKPAEKISTPVVESKPASRKNSYRGIGLLIGGIFILLALSLSVPLIGRWVSPSPSATVAVTLALSAQPIPVTQTVEPIQSSATPAATSITTEAGNPTSVSLPAEITDAKGAHMVLIPAGDFIMGLDSAQAAETCRLRGSECSPDWFAHYDDKHTASLDTFYIDKFEMTNSAYRACVDAKVCEPPKDKTSATHEFYYVQGSLFDNFPVINVNWGMADAFCRWRGARLPTEAEWEKAARGTDGRLYPPGNVLDPTYANILLSVGDTTSVGSYKQGVSPYGAFDMAGNVSEWVADWYSALYYINSPGANPKGPESGTTRVVKGESWYFEPDKGYGSVGNHVGLNPLSFNNHTGFRCARSANTTTAQPEITQTPESTQSASSFQYTPGPTSSVLNVMPQLTLPYQFSAHQKPVTRVAFSPDGSLFATGSADSTIKLWQVTDGKLVSALTGHTYNISGIAFSPDRVLLATGSLDNTIKVWNVSRGDLITTLKNPGKGITLNGITDIAIPSDGSFLLSDSYADMQFWDLSQFRVTENLCDRNGTCAASESMALSPDGKWVAVDGYDYTERKSFVRIFSVANRQVIQTLLLNDGGTGSLRFSPDGNFLAAGKTNNSVVMWNTSDWHMLHTFTGHQNVVTSVAFSPNGLLLASASRDKTIKLWRISDRALLRTLQGDSPVNSVAFSPGGALLLSGFDDGTVELWNVSTIN